MTTKVSQVKRVSASPAGLKDAAELAGESVRYKAVCRLVIRGHKVAALGGELGMELLMLGFHDAQYALA